MGRITFVEHDGSKHDVEFEAGESLMQVAMNNGVPGIDADCCGACACATCHVYVDESFMDKIEPKEDMEQTMLDFAPDVKETSRLSCQIKVKPELDGMVVRMPESQH
mgnify:CR=1 FL=1